jgi:uncharacterized protein YndB with AHSA1/START domain
LSHDKVRVTTFVEVSSADAFAVFTDEIDAWWRRGPRFRFDKSGLGTLRFEGGVGGRLVESFADGSEFEVGKVLAWDPGAKVAFEWRSQAFEPKDKTTVLVTFAAKGDGTEVVVEHTGWSQFPDGHAVRHGNVGTAFTDMLGLFWGELATGYRAFVKSAKSPRLID